MSGKIKLVVAAFGTLAVLLLGIAAYVLLSLDANSYKAEIQKAAADHQVELEIKGDLGLSIFPKLALTVGETHFSSEAYQLPPSSFKFAALSLDIIALLKKQIAINALEIRDADIHLTQLEQAAAVAATSPRDGSAVESESGNLAIAIDRIEVANSSFTLHGGESETRVDQVNLTSTNINTRGEPFALEVSLDYATEDENAPLSISATSEASFDPDTQTIAIKGLKATIGGLAKEQLTLNTDAIINLKEQTAEIANLQGVLGALTLAATANITHLDTEPSLEGRLELGGKNLADTIRALSDTEFVTANPDALSILNLTAGISASSKKLSLSGIKLQLDSTEFTGDLQMGLTGYRSLILNLSGTSINLDQYMPPDETDVEDAAPNEILLAPIIAPLAILDGGSGVIHLKLDEIVSSGITITSPALTLSASGKQIAISHLTLGIFGGEITAKGAVNADAEEPRISFSNQITSLDIKQALEYVSEDANLTGTLSMSIQGTTKGQAGEDLLNDLLANGNLSIKDPHLSSINIEQNYCEAAALIEQSPARENPWPKGTDLNDLTSNFRFNGPVLELVDYNTGVGNISLRGIGKIYLNDESFNIKAITRLDGEMTSPGGCTVKSRRIRNKDLPLICKDSFAKAGATSCKPDPDFLKSLLKDELIDKFLDDSKEGEEDPVKGLLKGLFGR